MTENRNYLQKYAMQFGAYLGIYYILKFFLFPMGLTVPFLQLIFLVLTIAVPFLAYYYGRKYRNKVCGGSINFMQAWMFMVFMYMFASLLAAVAHYIYFQFIDQGFLVNAYTGMIQDMKRMNLPGVTASLNQFEESLKIIGALSPIELTMQLISLNIFYGSLLAIPTALILMKKKPGISNVQQTEDNH
ncbi:MAG: DUF4199 domain-containing protein [Bacteroides sp.]